MSETTAVESLVGITYSAYGLVVRNRTGSEFLQFTSCPGGSWSPWKNIDAKLPKTRAVQIVGGLDDTGVARIFNMDEESRQIYMITRDGEGQWSSWAPVGGVAPIQGALAIAIAKEGVAIYLGDPKGNLYWLEYAGQWMPWDHILPKG